MLFSMVSEKGKIKGERRGLCAAKIILTSAWTLCCVGGATYVIN